MTEKKISITGLLAEMTLEEKLGQLQQVHGVGADTKDRIRRGQLGSILNLSEPTHPDRVAFYNEMQAIAVRESRLGIPLIIGRDVIHGLRTVMPIPLGQAASFNEAVVEAGAAVAAREAAAVGIHWTFAPMVDVSRDPRWGRVAESCGEDPLLNARLGAAMVRGFQGSDISDPERVAACVKHYVGYGAAEGGRDYNTTYIPENLLRDDYLPPFRACVDAGAATVMSAFNDLNGVPTSGNEFTLRRILKEEWKFDGMVVSDWAAVTEMIAHGYCADPKDAARAAITAGVDMEMVSTSYVDHAAQLLREGKITMAQIDDAVLRVLRIKERCGLFRDPFVDPARQTILGCEAHRVVAQQAATESCVLLKNEGLLPLSAAVRRVAVIGPLADAAMDQLGCWVMDGAHYTKDCVTPLAALRTEFGRRGIELVHVPGVADTRTLDESGMAAAVDAAASADVVLLFIGEDARLTGEAHCRAFLDLPGAQDRLARRVIGAGKPTVAVVMAGRPLTMGHVVSKLGALLWAWHPGTMAGPAIANLLLGVESPSGKLPVSFPQTVGQIPIYYACKNTGRPPAADMPPMELGTPLDPRGFCAQYLDVDSRPLFPFGFGLSYTTFEYSDLKVADSAPGVDGRLTVSVTLANTGTRAGTEVVQLYVRDLVGSRTRPVRELKDFARVTLQPGERRTVTFDLPVSKLAFHGSDMRCRVEPGTFRLWGGGSSEGGLTADFTVV